MTAHSGSLAARAIELITKHGTARSAWLAEQLDTDAANVSASLNQYVHDGTLVTCKVQREASGGRLENEYRMSSAGPGSKAFRDMHAARERRSPVVASGPIARTSPQIPSRLQLDEAEAAQAAVAPIFFPEPGPAPSTNRLEKSSMPLPAAALAVKPFRCALASDGSMILFVPGITQPVDLSAEDTNALVAYLRALARVEPAPAAPANDRSESMPCA